MPPREFSTLNCGWWIANAREGTFSLERPREFAHAGLRHLPAISTPPEVFGYKQKPNGDLGSRHPAFVRFFERTKPRSSAGKQPYFPYGTPTGTAKYGVLTLFGSIALPVISPLLFMPFAVSRRMGKLPLKSLRSIG